MDFVHPNLKLLNLNVFKALTKQKKPDKYPCRLCKPKLLILAAFDQPEINWALIMTTNIFLLVRLVSALSIVTYCLFLFHTVPLW